MFVSKFITRTLPGLVLASLALAACNDNPTAPMEEAAPGEQISAEGTTASLATGSATKPQIRGCFNWEEGAAYANQPVSLQYWTGGDNWTTSRTANTASNGCIQFNDISVNKYYRLKAYKVFGFPNCWIYQGISAWVGPTEANDYLWRTGYTVVERVLAGTPNYSTYTCGNWQYV